MCQAVAYIRLATTGWSRNARVPQSCFAVGSQPTCIRRNQHAARTCSGYKQYEWKWIAMTNGPWPVGCSAEQCGGRGETTCCRDPLSSAVTGQSLINRFVYLDCHLNFAEHPRQLRGTNTFTALEINVIIIMTLSNGPAFADVSTCRN
jgi:hypothetical protein